MIYDSQVYTALCISLLAAVAIRLGTTLYEYQTQK
jgi:photosystem I reaction center subunit XII